jgi:protein-tyrosine phosphatase
MSLFRLHNRTHTVTSVAIRPRGRGFTDIHCHCLPGRDDGPADGAGAVALCLALVADGVRTVVATPHQLGAYDGTNSGGQIREAVAQLNATLSGLKLTLTVLPGADVRIDERIPALVESGAVVTVADKRRYLLLELPHDVYVDPSSLLRDLQGMGIAAVITHPERQTFLAKHPEYVRRWAEYRPCLQITAGSFSGGFGRVAQEAAWAFLQEPLPLVVATDAHDTAGRSPRLAEAYTLLCRQLGRAAAETVCVDNAERIVNGGELLMVTTEGVSREAER